MRIPKVGNQFACLKEMVTRLGEAVGEVGMESCRGAGKELEVSFVIFLWPVGFWFRGFLVDFNMTIF